MKAFLALSMIAPTLCAAPSLTLYNDHFAVVRDSVTLDLKAGVNDVRYADATSRLEPSSVILRDRAGKVALRVLEQNYRNDPVSEPLLLSLFEGKEIEFETTLQSGETRRVKGRIVRSGYNPQGHTISPLIEVDGMLRFELPGRPIFPSLGDDTALKPTLSWKIDAGEASKVEGEVAYLTGGLSWQASYNVVAPETGDLLELTGWITMNNQSGKTFHEADIKLMAGDVQRVAPDVFPSAAPGLKMRAAVAAEVEEKSFDDFHLYTLARPATLRDQETKQVEFVRSGKVKADRLYIYDAATWGGPVNRVARSEGNRKIAIVQEFKNTKENGLGIALPKGNIRFYRQDTDGRLEFTGENRIDHTANNETLRLQTGYAFDLIGERKRTDYKTDEARRSTEETIEIKLRNRKTQPVEIRVVERINQWKSWEILRESQPYSKEDAQKIEFRVPLQPDEEKTVTYTIRYTW